MYANTKTRKKSKKKILERFAKGLSVSPELIQELEDDEPAAFYIEHNTVTNNNSPAQQSNFGSPNPISHYTPDKALYIALEQIQKLYESSMQLYREYLKTPEARFRNIEKKMEEMKEK